MSSFLLKDPDCVFVHIPKTGGSSIRYGVWKANYDGPYFNTLPSEWLSYFKFAFVRHPLDRLISAWGDFTQIRKFKGSFDDFVDIVLDELIIYDERRSNMRERIRHHTIPQTHPFNRLADAEFVGRYERYADDLLLVRRHLGAPLGPLPHERRTSHLDWSHYMSASTVKRMVSFYEQDFVSLGYAKP